MKINKRFFVIRLITLPFKLIFNIIWMLILAILITCKWLMYGGQELLYFKDNYVGNLSELIESNKELVNALQQNKNIKDED